MVDSATFRYVMRSDYDGDRHLIVVDPELDCTGWRLEMVEGGQTTLNAFHQATVWGAEAGTNLLGYGESWTAWVVLMNWGTSGGVILLPDGTRQELTRAERELYPSRPRSRRTDASSGESPPDEGV